MSVELDVLTETYLILKEYVPAKDRQAAADQLLGNLVDMEMDDAEFEKFCAIDSYLKRASEDYLDDDIDDNDDLDELTFNE
jgi:hypothetical protein